MVRLRPARRSTPKPSVRCNARGAGAVEPEHRSARGLPQRNARTGPQDWPLTHPGSPVLLRQARVVRWLGTAVAGPAVGRDHQGPLVRVVAPGHRQAHDRRRADDRPRPAPRRPGARAPPCDPRLVRRRRRATAVAARRRRAPVERTDGATAIIGVSPDRLRVTDFEAAGEAITAAYVNRGMPGSGRNMSAILTRLRLTLFHCGQLDAPKRARTKPPVAVSGWSEVPERCADPADATSPRLSSACGPKPSTTSTSRCASSAAGSITTAQG